MLHFLKYVFCILMEPDAFFFIKKIFGMSFFELASKGDKAKAMFG